MSLLNPPEKIYLTAIESDWEFSTHDGEFEYHLAPQWRDAVKDPPKENKSYWAQLSIIKICKEVFWDNSFGWYWTNSDGSAMSPTVIQYCELPEPPKKSVVDMAGYLPSDDEIHDAGFTLDEII